MTSIQKYTLQSGWRETCGERPGHVSQTCAAAAEFFSSRWASGWGEELNEVFAGIGILSHERG
jgi:hypothetical protein